MRTLRAFTLLCLSLCLPTYVSSNSGVESIVEIKEEPKVTINSSFKTYSDFLNDIGMMESSGRYYVVNTYGYMGKYQFSNNTLKSLGIIVGKKEFLNSPEIQEIAMNKLLRANKYTLRKYITKYSETTVRGIKISESGILAAAHIAGAGNVKKFFDKGQDFKDGYGTKLTDYLKKFYGYKLF